MAAKSILVVEDEGIVARDIQLRLRTLGYHLAGWVTTGEEAMRTAADLRPDLVLMDIRLRGEMDGISTAGAIRSELDIPVVYMTAYADDDTVARAKLTQPFGYILKPFQERDLQLVIEFALHKHAAERAVREREQWLATTLGSIGDAVIATDAQGIVTYLNPVAERLTGWPVADALGRDVAEVFVTRLETTGEFLAPPTERVLRERAVAGLANHTLLVARDGREFPIDDSAAPIIDGRGDLTGVVLVFRDVSERRRTEIERDHLLANLSVSNAQLRDERTFLETLLHNIPSPVLVVDEDFHLQMVNRSAQHVFGIRAERLNDAVVGNVLHCANARGREGRCGTLDACRLCEFRGPIRDAIGGAVVQRRRVEVCLGDSHEDRVTVLLVSSAPFEHAGKRLAIVILEDITELSGLRRLVGSETSFAGIVGADPAILEVFDAIREVASLNLPVLVQGESGTGKELVAQAIHGQGNRANRPFVAVNCGALPEGLLESELFGHVKGAFTGAIHEKKGRFELADGGTIFLDEVSDLSAPMQVKLLRVLQEGTFEKVGGERTLKVDVRIVSASNRDLMTEVKAGKFREDLYYRLCVVPITLPPLRRRLADVPLIAEHILERIAVLADSRPARLSPAAMAAIIDYPWPGNVRELQNVLQYAIVKAKGEAIDVRHLPAEIRNLEARQPARPVGRRRKLDLTEVMAALRRVDGNKVRAAKELGVARATLYRFLEEAARATAAV